MVATLDLKEQPRTIVWPQAVLGVRGQVGEWTGATGNNREHLNGSDGFFLKVFSLGRGFFAFWVSVNSETLALNTEQNTRML